MYNLINSKEIVGRILSSFNVPHRGWINLSPMWMADAIAEIGSPSVYELISEDLVLDDGATRIPCNTKLIESIKYRDNYLRIYHQDYNPMVFNTDEYYYNPDVKVTLENGYIVTDLSTDDYDLTLTYRKLKVEFDQTLGVGFPMIMDVSTLVQALQWYVLRNILLQGLDIKPLSFDPRVPDTNPAMQFEKYSKMARVDCVLDRLDMIEVHGMINTFILKHKPQP